MHPTKKWHYLVDGKTFKLEKKQAKLFVKFLGIKLKINRKYFTSIYGPTLKNKSGFYSIRTPSLFTIKSLEQWWRLNKANSFTEFYNILKKNDLPGYNIGYADKNDTIFYISNGIIPKRNDQYDWRKVVPGNTKKTLWDSYYKTEELPQVLNPKSGYIYNANHSPFKSTSKEENPIAENFPKNMGYELYDNNRSTRLYDLINSYDKIDYKDFKKIKYDRTLPTPLNYNYVNVNELFEMNPNDYPEISDLIKVIQNWDREAKVESFGAGAYAMVYYNLGKYYPKLKEDKIVSKEMLEECLKEVKLKMIESFGTNNVRLGDYQKLVRGNKEISIFGMPDVITAMRGVDYKDGKIKITHGESYIELVKFVDGKVEIESVISYGSSDHEDSPHYNDQMEMYSKFETKKMTFSKEEIYKNSKKIYNPK